jgi:hypothetical protein
MGNNSHWIPYIQKPVENKGLIKRINEIRRDEP